MRLFQWHGQLDAGTWAGLRLTVRRRCEDPRGERRGEERVVPSLRGPGAVRPSPAGSLHHAQGSPGPAGAGDQPWALWDLWGQGPRSGPEPILSLGHACTEPCPASAGAAGSHAARRGCTDVSALLLPPCGFVLCHQLRAVHLLRSEQGKKRMRLFLGERLHHQPGTVRCGAGKWLKRHVWHHKRVWYHKRVWHHKRALYSCR